MRKNPLIFSPGFMALFFFITVSVLGYEPGASTEFESSSKDSAKISVANFIIAASDGLSPSMTKKEVYDKKGVPDKINRLSGEEGKEMWVYWCQNDDGFSEDCLHLYFDGDRLVKIDRL